MTTVAFNALEDAVYTPFYTGLQAACAPDPVPLILWEANSERPPVDAPRLEPTIITGGSGAPEVGSEGVVSVGLKARRRFIGVLSVQIFAPILGSSELSYRAVANTIGAKITEAIEGQEAAGVTFLTTRLIPIGVDGPWFQLNANTGFTHETLT